MANTANSLLAGIFKKITSEVRHKIWERPLRQYLGELGLDFSDVRGLMQMTLKGK